MDVCERFTLTSEIPEWALRWDLQEAIWEIMDGRKGQFQGHRLSDHSLRLQYCSASVT